MRAPRASREAPTIVPAKAVVPAARARAIAAVRARAIAVVTQAAAATVQAGAVAQAGTIDLAAAATVPVRVAALQAARVVGAPGLLASMKTRIETEIRLPIAVLMKPCDGKTAYAIGRLRAAHCRPLRPAVAAETRIAMIAMVTDGEAIMIMVAALIEDETEALLTGTVMSANVDATTTRRASTRLPTTITTVMGLAPTNKVMRTGCVPARVMHGRARVTSPSARIFT